MDEENRLDELIYFAVRIVAFLAIALVFGGILMYAAKLDKYGKEGLRSTQPVETQIQTEATVPTEPAVPTEPEEQPTPDVVVGSMNDDYAITLTKQLPDELYILQYEHESGVMDTFAEVCRLRPGETYDRFIPQNTAPQLAARIGVYREDGMQVGHIPFAPSFVPDVAEKLYTFAVLSDLHIGYETAEADFQNALIYLSRQTKVDFICIAGDLTAACTDEQLLTYKTIVEKYAGEVPVYATTGEHDTAQFRGSDVTGLIEKYTGRNVNFSGTREQDVFILLANSRGGDAGRLFTREQLQWLQEKLEKNKDCRCFIIEHVPPTASAEGAQTGDLWGGTEAAVIESLLQHYPNVTFFHGHSHGALAEQKNYDNAQGYHSVHVPALYGAVKTDEKGNSVEDFSGSEGLLVDVYESTVVVRGFDFVQRKNIPLYTYRLDTALKTVEADTYVDPTMTINCNTVIPEWKYKQILGRFGVMVADEDYSTTDPVAIEKDNVYYVHQYWGCSYPAEVRYYDHVGNLLSTVPLWPDTGYCGPVRLEIPAAAVSFRIRQWTSGAEEELTKDLFITYGPQ